MKHRPTLATWARLAISLATALALASPAQAQIPDSAATPTAKAAPAAQAAPVKKQSRKQPNDTVSDDLNRRESERVEKMMQSMTASLTPGVATGEAAPAAGLAPMAPAVATPAAPPLATPAAPPPSADGQMPKILAQAVPPRPIPAPVPIQPPVAGSPAAPPTIVGGGAPGRSFGQSQVVSPQSPILTLEINKGTAIRLPSAAATVFVAAPDIADVQVRSPTMVYVFAKKPGETVLYAVDAQDNVLLNTIVRVTSPVSRMKDALEAQHPANGITYGNQGESIVLSGTVRSAVMAEDARRLALQHVNGNATKVINNIRVDAPNQVQLRVKVAEVRRDALKRVGINWQNINNVALFGLGGVTAGAAVRTVQSIGGQASGIAAFANSDNSLNGFIDFLATQSQATILAEPNLIAMSGETASFLAGGEIPIVVPQGGTSGAISITYKQVGVSLAFTPTIVGDRINLKVAPEVSQLSATGSITVPLTATAVVTVPGIQTRRASTTIELGSGQSFAIAGLLQASSQQDVVKLPWLGDIPVLGSLFKSDAYQRSETELVIIITPYFVEPTSGRLRTPLTDRVPPTDADRLVLQRLNHPTPPRRVAVGSPGASAGFRLD